MNHLTPALACSGPPLSLYLLPLLVLGVGDLGRGACAGGGRDHHLGLKPGLSRVRAGVPASGISGTRSPGPVTGASSRLSLPCTKLVSFVIDSERLREASEGDFSVIPATGIPSVSYGLSFLPSAPKRLSSSLRDNLGGVFSFSIKRLPPLFSSISSE